MRFTDENRVGTMASGAYDWVEYRAWWVDGRYWAYGDSGCSCTSFEVADDGPEPLGDVHALYADVRKFAQDHAHDLRVTDYMDFVAEVDEARRRGLGPQ